MELTKNQQVVFPNGKKEGHLEARWSEKYQAFYTFTEDGEKLFSTTIEEKPARAGKKFTPNVKNCKKQITPCGETEKAYIVYDGDNGYIGSKRKTYYKYIAKSICYTDENGNIFAPIWA